MPPAVDLAGVGQYHETHLPQLAALPDAEQERIAALILEEFAADRRWDKSFKRSEDVLAQLTDEALSEHHAGKTQPL